MTAPLDERLRERLAQTVASARMTAYEDGKGGWLFRSSTPDEIATALLPVVTEAVQQARGEVLTDAADDWVLRMHGVGNEAPARWLRERAAALAEPAGSEQ